MIHETEPMECERCGVFLGVMGYEDCRGVCDECRVRFRVKSRAHFWRWEELAVVVVEDDGPVSVAQPPGGCDDPQ